MILPVLFSLLSAGLALPLYEGDSCSFTNGSPGVCKSLYDCQSVFDEVVAGGQPDTVCGYKGNDPIICCPTSTPSTTTTKRPNSIKDRIEVGDGRGAIAREKCAFYSRYVYTLKYPIFGSPINVSQCAITSQKLISGGTKAERMEFPHMVALGYNADNSDTDWFCGGTLISEIFVLTAAHCTYVQNSGEVVWARIGDLNLVSSVDDGAKPETRRIVERIRHPDYKPPAEYHDIALLRLESRVSFNGWIRPACLHTKPETGTSKAIATGWGRVEWIDEKGSNNLLKVTLSLVDSKTCSGRWNGPADVKLPKGLDVPSTICAGHPGNDTCQGDSGGPLVIFSDEKYECMYDLVGVTSLGKLCGRNFPGIYTRVYHYVSWIESIVWPQG